MKKKNIPEKRLTKQSSFFKNINNNGYIPGEADQEKKNKKAKINIGHTEFLKIKNYHNNFVNIFENLD